MKKQRRRTKKIFRSALMLSGLTAWLLLPNFGFGEESLTKYQVEAVFLFNFAKYVDWPAAVFTNPAAPITIGVVGTDPFGDNLQHAVEDKTIQGHPFIIRHLAADADFSGCHILFISASETVQLDSILTRAGTSPILTVGEDEAFSQKNGIITFVLKDGKIRLEINLKTAKKTGLKISSRLLAVADVVKGN